MKKKKITPKKKFFYWFIPLVLFYIILTILIIVKTPLVYYLGLQNRLVNSNDVGFSIADIQDPTVKSYVLYAKPGDVIRQRLKLSNYNNDVVSLKLFSVDGNNVGFASDIKNKLESSKDDKDYIGKWITVDVEDVDNIELQPYQDKIIEFIIEVPDDIKYGYYSGGIIMDVNEELELLSLADRGNILVNINTALNIYLKVTNDVPMQDVDLWEDRLENSIHLGSIYFYILIVNFLLLVFLYFVSYPWSCRKNII